MIYHISQKMMFNVFEKGHSLEVIKRNAEIFLFIFVACSSLLGLMLFSSIVNYIHISSLTTLFILSLFILVFKVRFRTVAFIIIICFSLIFTTYLKLKHVDQTASAPLMIYVEIALCITLVFRFGVKYIKYVFGVLILFSILKAYLYSIGFYADYKVDILPSFGLFVIINFISAYILGISFYFYNRMKKLNIDLKAQVNELDDKITINNNLQKKLEILAKDLSDFSSSNSHLLRAPISRIQGIVGMIEEGALDPEWSNKDTYDFLYTNSITSLIEFESVLSEMDKTLHDKILALHKVYLELNPDK